jgi:ubiquinone/menaquinone biosynthesis C-methylase UbiE
LNEQEHIIETFSEMASRYEKLMNSELSRFWRIDYYGFIAEVLAEIEINTSDNILDIATGTSFIPRFMIAEKRAAKSITGLDLTYDMLLNGKKQLAEGENSQHVNLVCASAHAMPFMSGSFDIAICCLATHHMSVTQLLKEIHHALKPGATFHIGDVGGSAKWKIGFVRVIIKTLAFLYFLFSENLSRAIAESEAVANVMTSKEWHDRIVENGFEKITIREIKSSRFWTPNPVIIHATKKKEE